MCLRLWIWRTLHNQPDGCLRLWECDSKNLNWLQQAPLHSLNRALALPTNQPRLKPRLHQPEHWGEAKQIITERQFQDLGISGHVTVMFSQSNVVERSWNCHNEPWMIYGLHGQRQRDLSGAGYVVRGVVPPLAGGWKTTLKLFRTKVKLVRWANLIDFPRLMYNSGLLGTLYFATLWCWVKFDCVVHRDSVFVCVCVGVQTGRVGSNNTAALLLLLISPGLVCIFVTGNDV